MIKRLNSNRYISVFLFLLAFLIYSSNIGGVSIYILDEAKNVECAREMLKKKDLIVPTFNEVLRTDKPPLHYYFMMLGFTIFGENAFGARFFSAILGALTILITFLFTRKFAGKKTALLSAAILLASIHLGIQFHLAVPDPYLIFFMTSSLMCFFMAVKERENIYLLLMYVSIGFGVLAKGPIAIGLPGLIFLLFLIFSKRFKWSEIRRLRPFLGILIVFVIAAPWYILVYHATNGEWVESFLLNHNLGRFSSSMEGHGGIFLLPIVFILIGMFPFSAFIFRAIGKAWKNRKDEFILFNLVALLVVVVFFMISSTKLINYTVPAYPFIAILIAAYLSTKNRIQQLKTELIVLIILSILLLPAVYYGLRYDKALANVNDIAWYFIVLPLGMTLAFYFYREKRSEEVLLTVASSGIISSIVFFYFAFPVLDQQNPVTKSFHLADGKELRYFKRFNPAYSFAHKKEIPQIDNHEFQRFFENYPDGVVISSKKEIEKIKLPKNLEISFSSQDLFESPTTVLITKKEN